jgi:hypothetical protein
MMLMVAQMLQLYASVHRMKWGNATLKSEVLTLRNGLFATEDEDSLNRTSMILNVVHYDNAINSIIPVPLGICNSKFLCHYCDFEKEEYTFWSYRLHNCLHFISARKFGPLTTVLHKL